MERKTGQKRVTTDSATRRCLVCREEFIPPWRGRVPRFCSHACRQEAYRRRKRCQRYLARQKPEPELDAAVAGLFARLRAGTEAGEFRNDAESGPAAGGQGGETEEADVSSSVSVEADASPTEGEPDPTKAASDGEEPAAPVNAAGSGDQGRPSLVPV